MNILDEMKLNGWDGDENVDKLQWTFSGSLFYSIIVITTIGESILSLSLTYTGRLPWSA